MNWNENDMIFTTELFRFYFMWEIKKIQQRKQIEKKKFWYIYRYIKYRRVVHNDDWTLKCGKHICSDFFFVGLTRFKIQYCEMIDIRRKFNFFYIHMYEVSYRIASIAKSFLILFYYHSYENIANGTYKRQS